MNLIHDKHTILTLDAGGTNFVFSAYRGGAEIARPLTLPSNAHDLERCLASIYSGFDQVAATLGQRADAISFAFPGPADYEKGIIGDLPNFRAFNGGVPLGPMLEERFRVPVFINNDGNLFAYGEALAGFLPDLNARIRDRGGIKHFRNLVGLTLGTGFGCGIVLDKVLLSGDNSNDAGIHNTSNRFNPAWNAEESVSTRAIQRVYAEVAGGRLQEDLMPKDIFDIAEGRIPGDREAAIRAFAVFGEALGNSVANMLTLIDGIVVIGGGLAAAWKLFAPPMFAEINRKYETPSGEQYPRVSGRVFDLEDEAAFDAFAQGSVKEVAIPGTEKKIQYDEMQRTGVGLSKLSASRAIAIGANAFAASRLSGRSVLLSLLVLVGFALGTLAGYAQTQGAMQAQQEGCMPDGKFTKMFARDCCGVTGADGIYSVLLPDGRSVWIFGDSFLGTVNPDRSREKRKPWFVRNAMAVQENDTLRSLYQVIDGWESSLVIPPDAPKGRQFSEDSIWYWPGDGFIEGGKLKVFMSAFYQAKPGDWGFAWVSANLATFSLPDLKLEGIEHFNYPGSLEIHWGHAVCDGDERYTYIYGAENLSKNLYVARAPKGEIAGPWEFFDGSGWVGDSKLASPMLAIQGSEQFSVFRLQDKYVVVVQEGGFMTGEVVSYWSDNPYTGWRNRKVLCHTRLPQEVASTANLFAYNSLAHPQFIQNGMLLISSCINSFVVEDVFRDASKYRPQFQRVPVSRIFE